MNNRKIKGKVIACHDCRAYGYVVFQPWGIILPTLWKAVRVRWRWLYICGDCQQRRRREVTELLKQEPRRKWWRVQSRVRTETRNNLIYQGGTQYGIK